MAFDEALADRIRDGFQDVDGVTDKRMFGGITFMIHGNMAVGVMGDDLIVRLGAEAGLAALTEPGIRAFDFTGRPMKNWIVVDGDRLDDEGLARWLRAGLDFASSLPPK
ncbi:TfoX/Sxy family protein [Actinoplanes sp. L3-i22]|uniref:TfoX/Sxy family protein n=1 Tax=Actinoplanes sp. L3-i22 TaxID=2836373 RepID=UPI001C773386|nr:TfoX/Sxy family protein [Actinoplanes sp. L3-i22]BCY15444.1 RNA methyltransferase [Actinoplanes sp. L3-i22]